MVEIIKGVIDRRILVNFRLEPGRLSAILPPPFKPRVINGYAIGGICMIRFKKMRPAALPAFLGTSSENGTHRFCVEWNEDGQMRSGIYVKQRFTNSRLHEFGGDKVFPGKLTLAKFEIEEGDGRYRVSFKSPDGEHSDVTVRDTEVFPINSIFEDIEAASADFKKDKIGFSPITGKNSFKGVKLNTTNWTVSPLEVQAVSSSLFSNEDIFPGDSAQVDHALLMKDVDHNWQDVETLCCEA